MSLLRRIRRSETGQILLIFAWIIACILTGLQVTITNLEGIMIRSQRLLICFSATAVTFVGGAGAVLACSQPACWPANFPVADGAEVPANILALPYKAASSAAVPAGAASDPKAFTLLDEQGTPVAVEATPRPPGSQSFLIRPVAKLTAGKVYQVRYPSDCTATTFVQRSLKAVSEVDLPTEIGTVKASGHRIDSVRVQTSSGSCTTLITAALAKVTLAPSSQLRAYWPVAEISATTGGLSAPLATQKILPDGTLDLEVYAGCNVTDKGAATGLKPGLHTLQVHVKVPGAPELPPVTTSVELRCTEPVLDAGVMDSGIGGGVDSGFGTLPISDGGTNDGADAGTTDGAPENKRGASGGCSAVSGTPGSGGTLIAGLALFLLGYARRRLRGVLVR